MIVYMADGSKHTLNAVHNATGYRATALLLDPHDLADLAKLDAPTLKATVQQLSARVNRMEDNAFQSPEGADQLNSFLASRTINHENTMIAAGWKKHDGGPCPVDQDTKVQFRTRYEVDVERAGVQVEDAGKRSAASLRWHG